ncbi:MAG: bifunctional sterol desaturase/short chain dehydrogenase [Cyanobacteria bacterium J06641_5]
MFASNLIVGALWGLGSILWVEFVRDGYHALSHQWTPLYRLHSYHHRVFRKDLTVISDDIYRQAHWYNDVPEATVMLLLSGVPVWLSQQLNVPNVAWLGAAYTLVFMAGAIARGLGIAGAHELTDETHRPGPFPAPPVPWFVNRAYHWRHHFDSQTAYYSGVFTFADKLMGTALSLKGKRVAVTGASGTMGRALLRQLQARGAKPIALTSGTEPIVLEPGAKPIETIQWQLEREAEAIAAISRVDILILNHGVNVHGDRSVAGIEHSFAVNTFSSWRLLEAFLGTVQSNRDMACKEVWVNTSEAEVSPAISPLYELSKRVLGNLVTLRRLDAPCVIRKIILGPFKSNLNPIGVMDAGWVAKQVVNLAVRDARNIIVTVNPLTYLAFPIQEFCTATYYRWFSQPTVAAIAPELAAEPEPSKTHSAP